MEEGRCEASAMVRGCRPVKTESCSKRRALPLTRNSQPRISTSPRKERGEVEKARKRGEAWGEGAGTDAVFCRCQAPVDRINFALFSLRSINSILRFLATLQPPLQRMPAGLSAAPLYRPLGHRPQHLPLSPRYH